MEKLHYKSLRRKARHGMRKVWLVPITKPWKGHWFLGVRSQSLNTLHGEKKDGIWLSETFGSDFSPMWQWETKIDVAEITAINNSPRGEPGAVLMMLRRSCTSHLGFIVPDSEEDMEPGSLLWIPMAHQAGKPSLGASWACTYTFESTHSGVRCDSTITEDLYSQKVLVP